MFASNSSTNLSPKSNQLEITGNQNPKFVHKNYRKFVLLSRTFVTSYWKFTYCKWKSIQFPFRNCKTINNLINSLDTASDQGSILSKLITRAQRRNLPFFIAYNSQWRCDRNLILDFFVGSSTSILIINNKIEVPSDVEPNFFLGLCGPHAGRTKKHGFHLRIE